MALKRRRLDQMEESYLERIIIHFAHNDPDDRILKTYLDSWFAHSRGGALLTSGRPQWMNTGDLAAVPARCLEAHAISGNAKAIVDAALANGTRAIGLVRDHSIPKAVIITELRNRKIASLDLLRQFLRLWFTVAIITHVEHQKVGHQMPVHLSDDLLEHDVHARFARYRAADLDYTLLPAARETWE